MKTFINMQSTIARANNLLATDLDDEMILMSIENGSYYGMEKTARRIWELIESPQTVSSLIDILSQEFSVAPDVCKSDTIAYLQDLCEEGLLVVS